MARQKSAARRFFVGIINTNMSSELLRKYTAILEDTDDSDLFGTPADDSARAKMHAKSKKILGTAKEIRGIELQEGDLVVRGQPFNNIEVCRVTKVLGHMVYLNDSKRPVVFPNRLAVIGR